MKVDLTTMPSGERYEDRYGKYIEIFHRIAETNPKEPITVIHPPWCWVPLLLHLNCKIFQPVIVFPHCELVRGALTLQVSDVDLDRTAVEVLCGFRPETADCLWKVDMQWLSTRCRKYTPEKEFIVTNNGSYHRAEVQQFMAKLRSYTPKKPNVLLVPCAADKPYPAKLHQACLDRLPADFYLMNATGVLGLVPQDLWPYMPHYDSGIPNQWRLFETIQWYFKRHVHRQIVVYCDFYSLTIKHAFDAIRQLEKVQFAIPPQQYDDYLDLLHPNHLRSLDRCLRGFRS